MKIYRIPISPGFQDNYQSFIWPPQNRMDGWDFGVENDWTWWLDKHPELITDDPKEADWACIEIYWNRYYLNHWEDGRWGGGIKELSEEVDRVLAYDMPTFTIAEADIRVINPNIDFGDLIIFCASRRGDIGIDIPLLCGPHPIPEVLPEKKYLASFMGNLETDGIRMAMRDELKDRTDCRIEHAGVPENEFAQIMLESYIALAPRGQGAQSFRMFEALGLGITPLYISDLDCRPFRKWINWDSFSFYTETTNNLSEYLDQIKESDLIGMGRLARQIYLDYLCYGSWCGFVIRELELL